MSSNRLLTPAYFEETAKQEANASEPATSTPQQASENKTRASDSSMSGDINVHGHSQANFFFGRTYYGSQEAQGHVAQNRAEVPQGRAEVPRGRAEEAQGQAASLPQPMSDRSSSSPRDSRTKTASKLWPFLQTVARHIGKSYWQLASELEIEESAVEVIEANYERDLERVIWELLRKFQSAFRPDEKEKAREQVEQALIKIGKKEIAEEIVGESPRDQFAFSTNVV
ncbi:uncharacterized protein [Oscarella lobularis]|uniref:uncharacterized protein n=1 Tax=Oscarella lobularis TaxID=121494 RepID=UPI00331367C3